MSDNNSHSSGRRVTIKDIARHLQISPSTVSRALGNDPSIKLETREMILQAAIDLGYRRNRLAAGLKSGRTNLVGVIINDFKEASVMNYLEGMEHVFHSEGIGMLVANSQSSAERENLNIMMMGDAAVDGIIVSPIEEAGNESEFLKIKRGGVAMVFLKTTLPGIISSSVISDSEMTPGNAREMGAKAAELLLEAIRNPGMATKRVKF